VGAGKGGNGGEEEWMGVGEWGKKKGKERGNGRERGRRYWRGNGEGKTNRKCDVKWRGDRFGDRASWMQFAKNAALGSHR
jgi:hypothetical protein